MSRAFECMKFFRTLLPAAGNDVLGIAAPPQFQLLLPVDLDLCGNRLGPPSADGSRSSVSDSPVAHWCSDTAHLSSPAKTRQPQTIVLILEATPQHPALLGFPEE